MSEAESQARADTAKLIRDYYVAFNKGDSDGMLAFLTDDVIHDVNQGERREGKEKFRAFNARMTHHYKEELKDIAVMVSKDGTRAAAEFNVHGQYLNTDYGPSPGQGPDLCTAGRHVLRHPRRQDCARDDVLQSDRLDRPGLLRLACPSLPANAPPIPLRERNCPQWPSTSARSPVTRSRPCCPISRGCASSCSATGRISTTARSSTRRSISPSSPRRRARCASSRATATRSSAPRPAAPMIEHADEFGEPFNKAGYDLTKIFYCGEFVLLKSHRGHGLGHAFFDHREAQATKLGGFTHSTFCRVVRPDNHPLKPKDYVPLDGVLEEARLCARRRVSSPPTPGRTSTRTTRRSTPCSSG